MYVTNDDIDYNNWFYTTNKISIQYFLPTLCAGSKKKRASKKAMTQKTVKGEQSSKPPPPPAKTATTTTTTTTATKTSNNSPQALGYGLTVGCALVLVIAVGVFLLPYRFINKYWSNQIDIILFLCYMVFSLCSLFTFSLFHSLWFVTPEKWIEE